MTVPSVGSRLQSIVDGPERSRFEPRGGRLLLAGPASLLASEQERAGPFAMDRTA
jgi:hypothetical protein